MEFWLVWFYNELDADFGYDCGAQVAYHATDKATAKSIARHLNKITPDFISYWAESEPWRWT